MRKDVIDRQTLIDTVRNNPYLGDVTASLFIRFIEDCPSADEWIPVDTPPPSGEYILISFANYSVPIAGYYKEDEDGGGAYYAGDKNISLVQQDMIVNGWQPLPKCSED